MAKVTWNEENTAKLTELYEGDNDALKSIAKEFKTSVNSIRCKLVNLKLYVAPEKKATKTKSKASKFEMVSAVETLLSTSEGSLTSLEKATVKDLETLTNALVSISARSNAESGIKE